MLTIKKLSEITGVTKRALRFYEENELIKSTRGENNYRMYDESTLDQVQLILFFKYFGFTLAEIKEVLAKDKNAQMALLSAQRQKLEVQQAQIKRVLTTLDQTILEHNGGNKMTEEEKFAAFKEEKIAENEATYGTEIREKYGEEVVEQSNQKFKGLTQAQMARMDEIHAELGEKLGQYIESGQNNAQLAQEIFILHQEFLKLTWPNDHYSFEAHRGLGAMYVADPRFSKFYVDLTGKENAAEVLNQIIQGYAK